MPGTDESVSRKTVSEDVPVLTDVVKKGVDAALLLRSQSVRKSLSHAISELEKEMELVDGKAEDLLKKYAVTQEVADEASSVLMNADPRDFLPEPAVPYVDRGHALEIGLDDFPVFRILKIVPTAIRGSVVDTES